jgi:hypothetical protein
MFKRSHPSSTSTVMPTAYNQKNLDTKTGRAHRKTREHNILATTMDMPSIAFLSTINMFY